RRWVDAAVTRAAAGRRPLGAAAGVASVVPGEAERRSDERDPPGEGVRGEYGAALHPELQGEGRLGFVDEAELGLHGPPHLPVLAPITPPSVRIERVLAEIGGVGGEAPGRELAGDPDEGEDARRRRDFEAEPHGRVPRFELLS